MPLPVIAEVDLLIVGGNSAAVAAALSAAESGQSVMIAASRPYLGEDHAAFLRYDPPAVVPAFGPGRRLAERLFGAGTPTPNHLKGTLELEAVHAGVQLLYGTHPAGVLVDADDRIAGVCLAGRAGRQAVVAGAVIDATWCGDVARQAGCSFRRTGERQVEAIWMTAGGEPPDGGDAAGAFTFTREDGRETRVALWRHHLTGTVDIRVPGTLAELEVAARRRCFHRDQLFSSDALFFLPPERLEAGATHRGPVTAETFPLAALQAAPGLAMLSPSADLDDEAVASLIETSAFLEIGDRLGRALAVEKRRDLDSTTLRVRCAGAQSVDGVALPSRDRRGLPTRAGAPTIPGGHDLPRLGSWDVVVIGGGTAGAAAGIAAARAGRRVLVVEALAALGGLGTQGQIARYFCGYQAGFTAEVDAGVTALGGATEQRAWRVECKQAWWLEALTEAGGEVWFGSCACGARVRGGCVDGVVVAGPHGFGLVEATNVIDATGAADVAAAAGAEVCEVGAEAGAVQGTGLSPRLPGHDYNNSDHTFSDDGDPVDATRTFVTTRQKFREGFDIAQIIATRERRRVVADLMVQPEDIFAGRTWPDALSSAKSSFDTHGFTIHPLFSVLPPDHEPRQTAVPLRALLPRGLEGILVTGLGIGAHRDAMPVLRMQPCVQNQGYAAGLVAAAAAARDGRIRSLDLAPIQGKLQELGILDPNDVGPDTFPVSDAALETALSGLAEPSARDLAMVFAHPDRARPWLEAALAGTTGSAALRNTAIVFGLLGGATAAPVLRAAPSESGWDRGWNSRGMDQFGASRSPVDTLLHAAAGCGDASLFEPVLAKLEALCDWPMLAAGTELSHVQAVGAACAALAPHDRRGEFAPLLCRALTFHRVAGNHVCDWDAAFSNLPRAPNDNVARNRALRELTLAAALVACGDHEGHGRLVLERYADDWRGPLARYARRIQAHTLESAVIAPPGRSPAQD